MSISLAIVCKSSAKASNMAKLVAVLVTLAILLEVSTCAVAPHHGKPGGGSGTPGIMTVNGFQKGEDGGGPAECDGKYHSDKTLIMALSMGWYAGGRRCHKPIHITSRQNGRSLVATVVDECDSHHGCKDNIVDTSEAVWKALGLDSNIGEVPVTWSDA